MTKSPLVKFMTRRVDRVAWSSRSGAGGEEARESTAVRVKRSVRNRDRNVQQEARLSKEAKAGHPGRRERRMGAVRRGMARRSPWVSRRRSKGLRTKCESRPKVGAADTRPRAGKSSHLRHSSTSPRTASPWPHGTMPRSWSTTGTRAWPSTDTDPRGSERLATAMPLGAAWRDSRHERPGRCRRLVKNTERDGGGLHPWRAGAIAAYTASWYAADSSNALDAFLTPDGDAGSGLARPQEPGWDLCVDVRGGGAGLHHRRSAGNERHSSRRGAGRGFRKLSRTDASSLLS